MQHNFIKKNKTLWVMAAAAIVCLASTNSVRAESDILNSQGKKVGYINDHNCIYDTVTGSKGCLGPNGSFYNDDDKFVGRMDPHTGEISDKNNVTVGRYDQATGMIYYKNGNVVGQLQKDGGVYGPDHAYVGKVAPGSVISALMLLLKR